MGDFPYSFSSAFPEEYPGSELDKLGMLKELEHDGGLVAAPHALEGRDALDDGCLPDVAAVHGGPEALAHLGGVEEETDAGLEVETSNRLAPLEARGHHASPQLRDRDVQGKGRTLLGTHLK